MIYLQEIAAKLNDVLNATSFDSIQNPTDYLYRVETAGFHLDLNYDAKEHKNFIPVFISTMGGSVNPVPNLKQVNLNVPVTFYFPVRFKEDMFAIFDYLVEVFSGKMHEYGTDKRALSNVSVPNFGEIQNVDLGQFKDWIDTTYRTPIEVMEPYLSMTFTLYVQTSGPDYIYGNDVKISLVEFKKIVDRSAVSFLRDTDPTLIEYVDMANSEPDAQQLFSESFGKGYPANAAFTKQLPLILKHTSEYRELLEICEKNHNPQSLIVEITEEIPFIDAQGESQPLSVTNTYFITNYSRKTSKGELVGLQFTLSPRGDVI